MDLLTSSNRQLPPIKRSKLLIQKSSILTDNSIPKADQEPYPKGMPALSAKRKDAVYRSILNKSKINPRHALRLETSTALILVPLTLKGVSTLYINNIS